MKRQCLDETAKESIQVKHNANQRRTAMDYFEKQFVLYTLIGIFGLPVLSCLPFFRKRLWLAPILDLLLFLGVTWYFYPFYLQDIILGDLDFTTVYWLYLFVPMQIFLALCAMGAVLLLRKAVSILRRRRMRLPNNNSDFSK